jgi:hypothetical protein
MRPRKLALDSGPTALVNFFLMGNRFSEKSEQKIRAGRVYCVAGRLCQPSCRFSGEGDGPGVRGGYEEKIVQATLQAIRK